MDCVFIRPNFRPYALSATMSVPVRPSVSQSASWVFVTMLCHAPLQGVFEVRRGWWLQWRVRPWRHIYTITNTTKYTVYYSIPLYIPYRQANTWVAQLMNTTVWLAHKGTWLVFELLPDNIFSKRVPIEEIFGLQSPHSPCCIIYN